MFQDEASYLPEWIEFHRSVGVEHFFLYDNFSHDDHALVLRPWMEAGLVTVIDWNIRFKDGAQPKAYRHCLETFGDRARWIAFIDVDEFLFAPGQPSLASVLADYEDCPGVVVNWQVSGSSGRRHRPDGLVIENFVMRSRTQWIRNRRYKSIVDPKRALQPMGPHFFAYRQGELAVNENREPLQVFEARQRSRLLKPIACRLPLLPIDPYATRDTSVRRVSVSRLRVNHYVVKSAEEFETKFKDRQLGREEKGWYFSYHDRNEVHDPVLASMAPQVRSGLAGMAAWTAPSQARSSSCGSSRAR